ncbi:S49 family peptidase [Tenacibaculum dicentrarchi]|nr:S49 family peptidase [Tenacibaculum dicentrarchi]
MSVTDTIRQIKAGMWAVEPHYGIGLRETVEKIFAGTQNETYKKEKLDARHYLLDQNGTKFNSDSLNDISNNSIGVIDIRGAMIKYGNYYCWGADELVAQAKLFDKNPNIIAIIFVFDTGGGAVNAVAPFTDFLANKKKPVVAWADMCASAGYWVAAGCDYIMASNNISASFGSIGIMCSFRDASKYWEELGIKDHTIYSDLSTHKNKSFELALQGDYSLIKKEDLNPIALSFQNYVKANRPNLNLEEEGILEGKMFYAENSVVNGLADGIGNFQDALAKATQLAAVKSIMN